MKVRVKEVRLETGCPECLGPPIFRTDLQIRPMETALEAVKPVRGTICPSRLGKRPKKPFLPPGPPISCQSERRPHPPRNSPQTRASISEAQFFPHGQGVPKRSPPHWPDSRGSTWCM